MTTDQRAQCYCLACGYSLRGLERSGRCPECGRAFDLDEPATFTDQPVDNLPKPISIAIAIVSVAALGALWLFVLMLLPAAVDVIVWPLTGVSLVVNLVTTAMVVISAVWIYGRLRLPMLPWLVAYWVLGHVLPFGSGRFLMIFIDQGSMPAGHTLGTFVTMWNVWLYVTASLVRLLAVVMLLSEAAFLVSRMIDQRPRTMLLLLAARQHAAAFGIALIGLTLLNPLLILLFWLL